MSDLANTFRQAWLDAQGDTYADELERQSLEASAAQIPELAATLAELKNPEALLDAIRDRWLNLSCDGAFTIFTEADDTNHNPALRAAFTAGYRAALVRCAYEVHTFQYAADAAEAWESELLPKWMQP
jgi:hypothetical protein